MSKYEGTGHFWLPGRDETKVSGRLVFEPRQSGTLHLIGALGEHDLSGLEGNVKALHGVVEGSPATLVDCFQIHHQTRWGGGPPTQRIRVNRAFVGAQFDLSEQPLAFSRIVFGLEDLTPWIRASGLKLDADTKSNELKHRALGVNLPDEQVIVDGMNVKLWHRSIASRSDFREVRIREEHKFSLAPNGLLPVDQLLEAAGDLQDLVTAGLHGSCAYTSVVFHHPDLAQKLPSGRKHPHDIELLANWTVVATDREKAPTRRELVFSFKDVGGIEGVAKWLRLSATHRAAIARMMALRSDRNMFAEDRFVNVVAAAEGFHRKHTGVEKRNLKARLQELVVMAGPEFQARLSRVDDWIERVKNERNELAHHLDRRPRTDDPYHHYLAESTYWLLLLCLLRAMDAPEAIYQRVTDHDDVAWDLREVQALL